MGNIKKNDGDAICRNSLIPRSWKILCTNYNLSTKFDTMQCVVYIVSTCIFKRKQ